MKPLLIILPGWGGSKKTWSGFSDKASAFFDVFVLDLPCFGDEACPTAVWGVDEYAKFVEKKLEQFSDREVVLLGHSFGGQIAVHLVAEHKNICEKLILSGAAVYRKKHTLKSMVFKLIAVTGNVIFSMPILWKVKTKARSILYKAADSPDYLQTSGIQRDIFKKVIREDVSCELQNISAKTLVVWGENDSYTPLAHGKKIAEQIPNSFLKIIKGGTHGLHLNTSDELLLAIREFVSS